MNELQKIFGADLFEDKTLLPTLKQLAGIEKEKPFECVGTINEVRTALDIALRNYGHSPPPLLKEYVDCNQVSEQIPFDKLYNDFNKQNFLPPTFRQILLKHMQ